MPTWIAYILGAAALVTALGVLWKKVLRPVGKFVVQFVVAIQEMLPLLQELTSVFRDTPHAFKVLDEIVAQFRTDSGSSLRDAVNRLEEQAEKQSTAAEALRISALAQQQVVEMDRAQLRRVEIVLDRLDQNVKAGAATGLRNEERAIGVADDLAAAHKRADEAESNEAGAAADAAALKPLEES